MRYSRALACLALCALALLAAPQTNAADLPVVRVGKAQATALAFLPLELGDQAGIWQAVGIKLEISALRGDGQVQQGLTSGTIDVGLGSGPGLGFLAKGVPALGVAALAGPPDNMVMVIAPNSTIKKPSDLNGRKIGVTTGGSLTDWLTKQVAVQQKLAPTAITAVPLGDAKSLMAGLKTGEIDGFVAGTEVGYDLQDRGQGKVFIDFGSVVKDFHTHVIFARNDFISQHPDLLRKFLLGWFRSVAYMRAHRAETVKLGAKVEEMNEHAMAETYDATMPMMSNDGVFNPRALRHLAQSFVELGILDKAPDPNTLITTKFVPVHL